MVTTPSRGLRGQNSSSYAEQYAGLSDLLGEEENRMDDELEPQDRMVSVRYMVDDVEESIRFYTTHLGFSVINSFVPAFADVRRGNLRLLLSGPTSSAGRAMADGEVPGPGGWNRIHLVVDDVDSEITKLRSAGVRFRNEPVVGPGGKQVLVVDPSGNFVELFQPA